MSASLENPPTRLESPQPSLDTDIDRVAWKRVSPRYLKLRLVQRSIWTILCVALSAIPLLGHYIFHWNVPLWLGVGFSCSDAALARGSFCSCTSSGALLGIL